MTARSKAELEAAVTSGIVDNTAGLITPAVHRPILLDVLDSILVGDSPNALGQATQAVLDAWLGTGWRTSLTIDPWDATENYGAPHFVSHANKVWVLPSGSSLNEEPGTPGAPWHEVGAAAAAMAAAWAQAGNTDRIPVAKVVDPAGATVKDIVAYSGSGELVLQHGGNRLYLGTPTTYTEVSDIITTIVPRVPGIGDELAFICPPTLPTPPATCRCAPNSQTAPTRRPMRCNPPTECPSPPPT